ncbi:MAG: tRNA (adenosine(37)-N6)-threonylcarbamoyltransferase complex dimerization subunit type 1 TsaB [Brevinema sp.]
MNIKNILAIDTSIAQHLVLGIQTENTNCQKHLVIEQLESTLMSEISEMLIACDISLEDIDLFIIGAGPGSFMGLRLGFSVLRTWAWFYQKPIITVSSLDLLSKSIPNRTNKIIVPCIDGKMKRVFTNISVNNKKILEDSDLFPEELEKHLKKVASNYRDYDIEIFGSGASFIKEIADLKVNYHADTVIDKRCFADLKSFIPEKLDNYETLLAKSFPNYLRLSAAEMALEETKKLNH